MTQVLYKLRKNPRYGYSSHFGNSQATEKVILDIFPLDLVLSPGFVFCGVLRVQRFSLMQPLQTACSVYTELYAAIWIGIAYICYMYCCVEVKKCSCTHLIKSSMPYTSEKGTKSHFIVKLGQIDSLSNMGAIKIF